MTSHKIITHLPFLLLSFILCIIIPLIYVGSEHTIHAWDQTQYQDMTVFKALQIREIPHLSISAIYSQLLQIYESTGKNYSELHSILISPIFLLFGPSRLVYILSLSLFYLFPFVITIGAIAASITSENKVWAFRIGTLLAIFTPAVWLPTLNGYPDAGAAFLMSFAALLFIQDVALKSWWRLFFMGSCLAIAILFRRHFGYDVITFFVAVSVVQIYVAIKSKQPPPIIIKNLLLSGLRVCLIGIFMVGVLYLLGWPFIKRLMHTNFSDIYSSYERAYLVNINYYLSLYGWIAVIISIIGPLLILIKPNAILSREAALFILFAGIYSFVQWIVKVMQLGVHYTMHFTPWLILGIFLAIWYSWHTFHHQRRFITFGSIILIGLIFLITLLPLPFRSAYQFQQSPGAVSLLSKALPSNYPPPRRKDYNEVLRLTEYLKSIAGRIDPIYVVASSHVLNDDLLWHAHRDFHKIMMRTNTQNFWSGYQLNVLHWAPFADSYDNYPLQELVKAEYVILAKPFQHHLPQNQQKVIHVAFKAFEERWPYSNDFELLPKTFLLDNNVTVYIYKRIRPTSFQTLINTYKQIQSHFKKPPGGKTDWIGLNRNTYYITNNKHKGTHDVTVDRLDDSPASLLYLGTDSVKAKTIKGSVWFSSPDVKTFTIYMEGINEQGISLCSEQRHLSTNGAEFQIALKDSCSNYSFIQVRVLPEKAMDTTKMSKYISIKDLEVKK